MSAAHHAPDLSALPPESRAAFEAQAAALAAERAARLHLEAEMADQKAYAARLETLLREMRRARFGPRSEKLHPDQLALALEEIETAIAEAKTGHENRPAATAGKAGKPDAPERPKPHRALPADLPRIERVIEPDSIACPCGCGDMVRIGEDRAHRLDLVPAQLRVLVTIRPRYACPKSRAGVVQAPAPAHLIEGGLPTEALIAHVMVAKFSEHTPLYRQSQILARHGVTVDRSTLADWVGVAAWHLRPIVDRMTALLKRSGKLYMDETTIPVLDPGRGRTKTGYLWAMARDDRPWGGADPPGVVFSYIPSRAGEQAERLLTGFDGVLQVDGYAGYKRLARDGREGGRPLVLAQCWAHGRRKLIDATPKAGSPVAEEALRRIAALYAIEAEIRGRAPVERRAVRQARSKPLVEALGAWLGAQKERLSGSSKMGEAVRYILNGWGPLCVFLDDGRVEMDSNRVENMIRPHALTRKNALFAGHDEGAEAWARIASLIGTCRMNGVEPYGYMKAVLEAIAAGHPAARIDDLLPWAFAKPAAKAAA
jgi:transposase